MDKLTAELIVTQVVPEELHISPDGSRVAYTLRPQSKAGEHSTSAIWLGSIDGMEPARQFTAGQTQDTQPRWSPNGKQLAFLSDRAQRGTSQLYLISANGGEALALTNPEHKKAINNFDWSPGGGQIAFTSADEATPEETKKEQERDDAHVHGEQWPYARLRLLSIASKEVTTLVRQDRHISTFTWHPAGTSLAYTTQQTPDIESRAHEITLETIAVAGGEPQLICRFPCSIAALTWSQDGETLYFIASVVAKSQSSSAVYAVPASGGEPVRILGGETNCVEALRPTYQQDYPVAILLGEGLESRVVLLNALNGTTHTLLPPTNGAQGLAYDAWDVRSKADGELVAAAVRSSGTQLWEIWTGSGSDQTPLTLQQISHHQEPFAGITFGTQEPFFWTASDGLKLDGILIRPPTAPDNAPLPTIVLVHGGPYSRWDQSLHLHSLNWGQWLALAGYAVLLPNPRGGSGHGEAFAAAARGNVGQADYQDVIAAIDTAIERGIADPARLGIGGWSQGGFMSAWAVTQTSRFKAAIVGAGVSDWGMMVMTSDVPDFEQELGEHAPWDGAAHRRHLELSPITFARNVKTPVLILHGEKDARVPLSQATGFYRALKRQNVPVEFVVYPREPHSIAEKAHLLDILQRVRSWYDRWLYP